MKVLVTGGAGYVGGVSVDAILAAGHEVVILDDLTTGHRAIAHPDARLVVGSYGDDAMIGPLLRQERPDAILHCAARSLVGESVRDPGRYYRDNVAGGIVLLEAARAAGVERLVFSSTAAVYGVPDATPIEEDAILRPINPYGETKRTFEGALRLVRGRLRPPEREPPLLQRGRRDGAARRGPPPGDAPGAERADRRRGRRALDAVRRGLPDARRDAGPGLHPRRRPRGCAPRRPRIRRRTPRRRPVACNLGTSSGFSVRDVLRTAEAVVGRPIPHTVGPRRAGDPPVLVASNAKARRVLGWEPRRSTLEAMIGSAWAWRLAHPDGYQDSAARESQD